MIKIKESTGFFKCYTYRLKYILPLALTYFVCIKSNSNHRIENLIQSCCDGELRSSYTGLIPFKDARAYHTLSALEYILFANSSGSVYFHLLAKELNPKQVPPLAGLHLSGKTCGGLCDLFYVTAVIIKKLVDTSTSSSAAYEGHVTLVTLLSDSGLSREAERHLSAALNLNHEEANLRIRSVLMFPSVFDSLEHVESTRYLLESRLSNLLSRAQGKYVLLTDANNYSDTSPIRTTASTSPNHPIRIDKIDEFTMSPWFYLVYQGYNDASYLSSLNQLYSIAHPPLCQSHIDSAFHTSPPHEQHHHHSTAANKDIHSMDASRYRDSQLHKHVVRVGFVSAHFNKHSICKLFCDIILQLADRRDPLQSFSSASPTSTDTEPVAVSGSQTRSIPRETVSEFNQSLEIFVFSSLPAHAEDSYTKRLKAHPNITYVPTGADLATDLRPQRALVD